MELDPDEKTEAQIAVMERGMEDDGVPTHEAVQEDYFAFNETFFVYLPDKKSFVECKALNEGQRRQYLAKVNRDVRLQRATGDAIMRMSPGDEKKALLEQSIVDWNLIRDGRPVPFNQQNLSKFLDAPDPRIIDLIDKEVRKHNEWILADATVEDIDKQIAELQELRARKVEETEGKGN